MKVRVIKTIKVSRDLYNGRATFFFKPGDYEVPGEIPEDVARAAIQRGDAKRLRTKGQRETKVA